MTEILAMQHLHIVHTACLTSLPSYNIIDLLYHGALPGCGARSTSVVGSPPVYGSRFCMDWPTPRLPIKHNSGDAGARWSLSGLFPG